MNTPQAAELVMQFRNLDREEIVAAIKDAQNLLSELGQALRILDLLKTGEPVVRLPEFTLPANAIPAYQPIPLKPAEPGDILDPAETAVNTHHAEPPNIFEADAHEPPSLAIHRYMKRHQSAADSDIARETGLKLKTVQAILNDGPYQKLASGNWKLLKEHS